MHLNWENKWIHYYTLKMPQDKISFSNILVLLCFLATFAVTLYPNLYQFGLNRDFFEQGIYHVWIIQFFTSQLLHGNFLHFLSNAIFLFYFWNILEQFIGRERMMFFFMSTSIFIWLGLTFFDAGNTVGISGFALALLTYYTLLLWKKRNPEYTGGITAIVLNIALWFVPWISFWGHFLGFIFGVVFFFIFSRLKNL